MANTASPDTAQRQCVWTRVGQESAFVAAGAGLGAALMYLFDPRRGPARRNKLIAESAELLHLDRRQLARRGRDLLNRVRRAMPETTALRYLR